MAAGSHLGHLDLSKRDLRDISNSGGNQQAIIIALLNIFLYTKYCEKYRYSSDDSLALFVKLQFDKDFVKLSTFEKLIWFC